MQHTWSLGIEEQFYLVWPLFIAALTIGLAARRARTVLVLLCCAGAGISQLLCSRFFRPDAIARAYYGTDTRAQALLIGAALAAMLASASNEPKSRHRIPARHGGRTALALAGAAGTLWFWHVASEQASWLYHGGLTAAALGTAAIVAHVVSGPGSVLARLLGLAPLVRLGRISYGVYL